MWMVSSNYRQRCTIWLPLPRLRRFETCGRQRANNASTLPFHIHWENLTKLYIFVAEDGRQCRGKSQTIGAQHFQWRRQQLIRLLRYNTTVRDILQKYGLTFLQIGILTCI